MDYFAKKILFQILFLLISFQPILGEAAEDGGESTVLTSLLDFSDAFAIAIREYEIFAELIEVFKVGSHTILSVVDLVAYFLDLALADSPPVPYFDPEEWWGDDSTKNNHDTSIRPFRIEFNDSMIADLKKRLNLTRPLLPALNGENIGQNYGTHSLLLQDAINYWTNKYDFKTREKFLNQYDHYKTNIQGLDIHYVHAYPKNPGNKKVVPALLVHGGGTSFREFFDTVPYLITPRNDCDFVYEVIIPDLPGYGYSQATSKVGLGFHRMAVILRNLMQRLGYKQYYIQAGDLGHGVSTAISVIYPDDVLGFHSNFAISLRLRTFWRYFLGSFNPQSVVEPKYESRMYPLRERIRYYLTLLGYFHFISVKPDTLAGIDQSPSAILAYKLQPGVETGNYDNRNKSLGGLNGNYQNLMDTSTIQWATKTTQSSFRLYAESMAFVQDPTIYQMFENQALVPFAVLKTRYELFYWPDSFLKDKFPYLLHSTTLDYGGHSVAQGNPDVLAYEFFNATIKFMAFNKEKNRVKT